jgi:predicted PolB exonuclease-like 3'-5' exonuclease
MRAGVGDNAAPTIWFPEEQFPPPQAHRIVAISWCDLSSGDTDYYQFDNCKSFSLWSSDKAKSDELEAQLISHFTEAEENDVAQLVTWNGRGFDLPVINLRAMKHKIPMGWYYKEDGMRYRFSEGGHCDLMDFLGDYGAGRNMKLNDVCRLIGLPGKTGEVSGSGVAGIVKDGDDDIAMESVKRYCLTDSIQTALVFVRSRFHKGMISAREHDSAVASFAAAPAVTAALPNVNWAEFMVSP